MWKNYVLGFVLVLCKLSFVKDKDWEFLVIPYLNVPLLHLVRISCSTFMALLGNIWCRPSTSQTSWYFVCGTLWKTWSNKWWSVHYSPCVISDTSGRSRYHWQIHVAGSVQATGRWTTWKAAQKYGCPSACDSVNRIHAMEEDTTVMLGRVLTG